MLGITRWCPIAFTTALLYGPSPCPSDKIKFEVLWDARTLLHECQNKYNISLVQTLQRAEITTNPFRGPKENFIRFTKAFGVYPYVDKYTGEVVNGGVPQAVDMKRHLAALHEDINEYMPNKQFCGPAVIDWERWAPEWARNIGKKRSHRRFSKQLVRAQHPEWSARRVGKKARRVFEKNARLYLLRSLKLSHATRPDAKWGIYYVPHCHDSGLRTCSTRDQKLNDEISWLVKASSGLYPSSYFKKNWSTPEARNHVFRVVGEAKRLLKGRTGVPVYFYSKLTYKPGNERNITFYSKEDLYNSICLAAMVGANGVALWAADDDELSRRDCLQLKDHIKSDLGPTVLSVQMFVSRCSRKICSGHGRCKLMASHSAVLQSHEASNHKFSAQRSQTTDDKEDLATVALVARLFQNRQQSKVPRIENMDRIIQNEKASFTCECHSGWTGKHCDILKP